MSTTRSLATAWLIASVLSIQGCGAPERAEGQSGSSTIATGTQSTVTTAAFATTTTTANFEPAYEWPDDTTAVVAYWASLRMASFELFRFRTVEDLADSATIVVVGTPIGPGPTALIGGDPDNDEVTTNYSLVVEVNDVVRSRGGLLGISTPRVGDQITIIVDHDPSRRDLSTAPVLLFLQAPDDNRYYFQAPPEAIAPEHRDYYIQTLEAFEAWRAGKYMFLNSQSVLAGDDRTTISPMMPANADLLSPLISGTPIADIVEMIRAMPPPEL